MLMEGSGSVGKVHAYVLLFRHSLKNHKCLVEFISIFGFFPVCLILGRELTVEKLPVIVGLSKTTQ